MTGGDTTKRAVMAAFALGEPRCAYCDRPLRLDVPITNDDRAVGDHRTPRARGGANTLHNIAVACHRCDKDKGTLTAAEFISVRNDQQARKQLIRDTNRNLRSSGSVAGPPLRRKPPPLTQRIRVPTTDADGRPAWSPSRPASSDERKVVFPSGATMFVPGRPSRSDWRFIATTYEPS